MMGSLTLTMIYDLFYFHAKDKSTINATERKSTLVKELMSILSTGSAKYHREVNYYAQQLHVTPKYLSDTIKRTTGHSVTYIIDQHTRPIIIEFLKNSTLSISQIADHMNFSSVSYFTRYVTKHLGMSPSKFRDSLLPTS